ncbi:response regulator [Ideonella livida]|uniref:Response regulator transcription factor n=1 Tax=Ideonella livida TaxID=2707176 RepID=A0A7C9TKL2_9BURK|nr:response regulator transcription factor [Ideonella livida]NDY92801.1 response regulator transcription factor [Ideonella livida]
MNLLTPTRLLLADDHAIFREGLRLFLASQPGWTVVGEVASVDAVLPQVQALAPDLVLLDFHMPGGDVHALIRYLKQRDPRLKVVLLTGSGSGVVLQQADLAGADGLLLKEMGGAALLGHLQAVMQGITVRPPEVMERVAEVQVQLTPRELQIARLVCEGHSNATMGELLHLSPKTVDKHRENLMRKLQTRNVAQLIGKLQALGWLDPPA